MALDGVFVRRLAAELSLLDGGFVDKVFQPYRDQLIILLRQRSGVSKLLVTCKADAPRIHLTEHSYDNPPQPPMLCMLLRKRLVGAKLTGIAQEGLERVIRLRFEGRNDFGDPQITDLFVEMMGRNSNVILVGGDGVVIDALRRVDVDSGSRPVYPGLAYTPPPVKPHPSFLADSGAAVCDRMRQFFAQRRLEDALAESVWGLSAVNCREILYRAGLVGPQTPAGLAPAEYDRLCRELDTAIAGIDSDVSEPTAVYDAAGNAVDFSYMRLTQYDADNCRGYPSLSALLDEFYYTREHQERIRQQGRDLSKLVAVLRDRARRKLVSQRQELESARGAEQYRVFGELLHANFAAVRKGDTSVEVVDYYTPEQSLVTIPLRGELSPSQNAQRYYKLYRKAVTAAKQLVGFIEQGEREIAYFESVLYYLDYARNPEDILQVREELAQLGYLRLRGREAAASAKQKQKKKSALDEPMVFVSSAGMTVWVGKNNRQNDHMTFRMAHGNDVWLHARNVPGSHVIIRTAGGQPDHATLTEAATLAALFSKNGNSAQVAVDYTTVKRVKKPAGAMPGMVNYFNFSTAVVTPDPELPQRLETPQTDQ